MIVIYEKNIMRWQRINDFYYNCDEIRYDELSIMRLLMYLRVYMYMMCVEGLFLFICIYSSCVWL